MKHLSKASPVVCICPVYFLKCTLTVMYILSKTHLQSIPIRVTAGGPLVWEVQQEINPVGGAPPIGHVGQFSLSTLQYINTTWRLFAPLSNTGHSPDTFSTFAEWQTK